MRLFLAYSTILLSQVSAGAQTSVKADEFDILITDGMVVDGTGTLAYRADVGIADGRLVFVGDGSGQAAKKIIRATGLIISPGFIDVHSHADFALENPENYGIENFVIQGVTTAVVGPDGWYAPAALQKYQSEFGKGGLGLNMAFYVGHNGIRRQVMGDAKRTSSSEELEQMKALVREGMQLGAVGFSTGLMYPGGLYSNTGEVVELAKVSASLGGTYDSHVRNPVHEFIKSHREAIEIGTKANMPAKLGHVKAVGRENDGRIEEFISLVNKARSKGLDIVSDQYPYDGASSARIEDILFVPGMERGWDIDTDYDEIKRLLAEPDSRALIRASSENGIDGGFSWIKTSGYSAMRVVHSPSNPKLLGKLLIDIAKDAGRDPFDAVADLIIEADEPVIITLGSVEEADVRSLLIQPWNMISSDGVYVAPGQTGHTFSSHPRSTGTFPRILGHYVRDLGILSMPEGIRKMTSQPARHLKMTCRGEIAVGYLADVTIFDPQTVSDRSTWARPNIYPVGIQYVIVGGTLVLEEGKFTGARPGRFLGRDKEC